MNRLAIVTYWAPPEGAIASHRVLRLSRALLRAGHEVHWVTIEPDHLNGTLDRTLAAQIPTEVTRHGLGGPCIATRPKARNVLEKVLRTLAFKLPEWFALPDGHIGWTQRVRRNLARIVRENAIDTVFFCLGPHGSLMTVPKLRRQFPDLRILVDYRDLLSGNFWRQPKRERLRAKLLARERHALAFADALFVNTEEAKKRMLEIVQPAASLPVHVMRNTADYELGELLGSDLEVPDFGEGVHIGYFGEVFARRRLRPILAGLNALEPELAAKFRLHLFVDEYSRRFMDEDLAEMGGPAAQAVRYHDPVPYGQALRAMRAMDALVLVNGATKDDRIFVPGKLFDYLMARRPIVFAGSVGDAWKIVAHCCGEEWCSSHDDPDRLAGALRRTAEKRPDDLPVYDEHMPQTSFAPLLTMLED